MKLSRLTGLSGDYYLQKLAETAHQIWRVVTDLRTATLAPSGTSVGRVLISYQVDPFVTSAAAKADHDHPMNWHSSHWECVQMAHSFLELGYCVDVIHFLNRAFTPRKRYDVAIDIRYNLERWVSDLPETCLRVLHIDSAHYLSRNAAEAKRLLDVQQRRGVCLQPRRWENASFGIENAHCGTALGNEVTLATYRYAGKQLFGMNVSSMLEGPWDSGKDFDRCRNTFLWLGSAGAVAKGLDLVLEAFAQLPQCRLIVCGAVEKEPDFFRAYRRELEGMPNIERVGWVNIRSEQFADICRRSVALVYPSCSEGQAGAVVNCMSAGLIPMVSREAGIDIDESTVLLPTCTVEEIRAEVERLSQLPAEDLRSVSHAVWKRAAKKHSRQAWAEQYRHLLREILELHARGEFEQRPLKDNEPSAMGGTFALGKG